MASIKAGYHAVAVQLHERTGKETQATRASVVVFPSACCAASSSRSAGCNWIVCSASSFGVPTHTVLPATDMGTRVRLSKTLEAYLASRAGHAEPQYEALLESR